MIETVELRRVESKSLLLEMLRGSQHFLLGIDTDAPREFYSVEVHLGSDVQRFGILSDGIGVRPGWIIRNQKLYIGLNQQVAIVHGNDSLELVAEVPLLTLFWAVPRCHRFYR
jgi:hypothetical protein